MPNIHHEITRWFKTHSDGCRHRNTLLPPFKTFNQTFQEILRKKFKSWLRFLCIQKTTPICLQNLKIFVLKHLVIYLHTKLQEFIFKDLRRKSMNLTNYLVSIFLSELSQLFNTIDQCSIPLLSNENHV